MGRFIADVVFAVELEDVTEGGRRLHELSALAATLGFELQRGQVREEQPSEPPQSDWTAYAPE